jgi:hypothetical protein
MLHMPANDSYVIKNITEVNFADLLSKEALVPIRANKMFLNYYWAHFPMKELW